MDQPNKKQKVVETTSSVLLFNSDTLSKIISYIPSVDVLNLAITCKRFGISDDGEHSLIEESVRIAVQDIATEEQLAALPHYDGESSLADYHYLQLLRKPLTFDQLVGAEYVISGTKNLVQIDGRLSAWGGGWATAFSNNIMRAGKHYVSFMPYSNSFLLVGVMRPGQANQIARGRPYNQIARGLPYTKQFYHNFSQSNSRDQHNNDVQCCLYNRDTGNCLLSSWPVDSSNTRTYSIERWEGMETTPTSRKIGMLLDLDEGTLSVYRNKRKLGVMKSGLAGTYCWVVSMHKSTQVSIKRGTIPS